MRRLITFVVLACTSLAAAAVPRTSADDLRRLKLSEPALAIIDVRDAKAFVQGHIQGALNIPSNDVLSANLPKTGPIVVYCSEDPCALTANAAEKLISYGYQDVSILEGGFGAWLAKGYPAQTDATTPRPASPARRQLRVEEAREETKKESTVVIDLRSSPEFAVGHLPGAKDVPLEELDSAMAWLAKEKELLVYDVNSARSAQAARKLKANGFNVVELSGGLAAWVKKGESLVVK